MFISKSRICDCSLKSILGVDIFSLCDQNKVNHFAGLETQSLGAFVNQTNNISLSLHASTANSVPSGQKFFWSHAHTFAVYMTVTDDRVSRSSYHPLLPSIQQAVSKKNDKGQTLTFQMLSMSMSNVFTFLKMYNQILILE